MTGPEYEPTDDDLYLQELGRVMELDVKYEDSLTIEDEFDQGVHGEGGGETAGCTNGPVGAPGE